MSFTNEKAQTIQSSLLIQLLSFLAFFLQIRHLEIVLVQVLQKATCSEIRTWILEEVWQGIISWWLWCFDFFTSSCSFIGEYGIEGRPAESYIVECACTG